MSNYNIEMLSNGNKVFTDIINSRRAAHYQRTTALLYARRRPRRSYRHRMGYTL
jgi:hypothetical protein